jgi:tRNA1Val (adenine37-N6)-methyltransferase
MGDLSVFTDAARRLLGPRGRACFIYPALELATLFETLRSSGLEPKRLRLVHASAEHAARVALVEALPAKRGGLVVLPALVERDTSGPSADLLRILAER